MSSEVKDPATEQLHPGRRREELDAVRGGQSCRRSLVGSLGESGCWRVASLLPSPLGCGDRSFIGLLLLLLLASLFSSSH